MDLLLLVSSQNPQSRVGERQCVGSRGPEQMRPRGPLSTAPTPRVRVAVRIIMVSGMLRSQLLFVNSITSSPVVVRSIAISVSVCLFVCLVVRSHISKTTRPSFTKFSVHAWPWICAALTAVQYVMYFRFCG